MKRIIFTIFLAVLAISGNARSKDKHVSEVDAYTFYGVNFAKCHTYGWGEDPNATIKALADINNLFIQEMNKYDLEKYLKKHVKNMDVSVSIKQTLAKDPTTIETFDSQTRIPLDTIKSVLQGLELKDTTGYGLMIFGDFLSKKDKAGTYAYVFFDISTREIVEMWGSTGEAGGFGFRNYWAKSVYNSMADTRFTGIYYRARHLPEKFRRAKENDDDIY